VMKVTLCRDQDTPLPVGLVSRIFVLSFVFINLITLNASSLPEIPDPGVTVTPGSICCGDCITVTIPVKNLRSVTFHGRIEIYVIDAKGYTNPQNSLSITLSPKEKRSFQTVICLREPCNSFGTYKVTAKVVEDNGNVHATDSAYFTVRDCGPSCDPPPGWTQTYRCNGNVLERLYVNDDCSEEWRTYEDCTPGVCKYGVCAPGGTQPPEDDTCDQLECQNRNKKIGESYAKNGRLYQRYQECNCVDGNCKCERVEKEVPCEGTISGHVYNAETGRPISGAEVSCLGGQYPCYPVTDSGGFYRSCSCFCPSTSCDITCTAEGYESASRTVTTDNEGKSENVDFYLQLKSGEVKFRGEIVRGGEDDPSQVVSYHYFTIKVTDILEDSSRRLSEGEIVGVSSHRDGPASVDMVYNGDEVEVYGNCYSNDDEMIYGEVVDSTIKLEDRSHYIKRMAPVTKDIKFIGTCTASSWATMDFGFDFFEVDEVLEGPDIEGDEVMVSCVIGPYDLGNYDAVTKGDKAEVYARFQVADGKRYEEKVGREVWDADITGDKNYYIMKINQPPKLISLEPDLSSPQGGGTIITWTATANDSDNDQIYYRFRLMTISSKSEIVRSWSSDNEWVWDTNSYESNNYIIIVDIRDGKHGDVDDNLGAEYNIIEFLTIGQILELRIKNPDIMGKTVASKGFVLFSMHDTVKDLEAIDNILYYIAKLGSVTLSENFVTNWFKYTMGLDQICVTPISGEDRYFVEEYGFLPYFSAYFEEDYSWPEPGSVIYFHGSWEQRTLLESEIGGTFRIDGIIIDKTYNAYNSLYDLPDGSPVKMMAVINSTEYNDDPYIKTPNQNIYLDPPVGFTSNVVIEFEGVITDKNYVDQKMNCTIKVNNLKHILEF